MTTGDLTGRLDHLMMALQQEGRLDDAATVHEALDVLAADANVDRSVFLADEHEEDDEDGEEAEYGRCPGDDQTDQAQEAAEAASR